MTSTDPRPPSAVDLRPQPPLGVIVALACIGQFMVVLDTSIVNVALPSMRADLQLSAAGQQWVITGYLITFGGLLLLAARAGDLFGHKNLFLAGLALFTLASLAGGLAADDVMLLVCRAVQGVGAAALAPASLSLITSTHEDQRGRAKALALWSVAASSAGAAGMVLGGLLTTGLNWRWVLLVNVPIGIVLILAAARYLRTTRGSADQPLDVPGAVTITLGSGALVYGISQATVSGWGSAPVIIALIAAAALLTAFVVIENRVSTPLVPLTIFAHHNLRIANLIGILLGVTMTSTFFFLSVYLQEGVGYSALWTGLALVPWTVALVAGVFLARALLPVTGPRIMLVAGAALTAGGLAWLARLPDHSVYAADILGPTILMGLGMSAMVLPVTIAATSEVGAGRAGLASGLVNTGRQIGGAVGLAVLVTVAGQVTAGATDGTAGLIAGFRVALLITAGCSLLAGAISLGLRRNRPAAPAA